MRDSHNGDQFEGCKRLLLRFLVPVFRFNRRLQPSNWSPLWESRISLDNGTIACSLCRLSQLSSTCTRLALHSPRPELAPTCPASPCADLIVFSNGANPRRSFAFGGVSA